MFIDIVENEFFNEYYYDIIDVEELSIQHGLTYYDDIYKYCNILYKTYCMKNGDIQYNDEFIDEFCEHLTGKIVGFMEQFKETMDDFTSEKILTKYEEM